MSRDGGLADFSGEDSPKITELLNPMTWFKKTKKVNTFEINAELGTVRVECFFASRAFTNN